MPVRSSALEENGEVIKRSTHIFPDSSALAQGDAARGSASSGRVCVDSPFVEPTYRAWFPDGKDDREATAIRVVIERIDYWEPPSTRVVRLVQAIKALVSDRGVDSKPALALVLRTLWFRPMGDAGIPSDGIRCCHSVEVARPRSLPFNDGTWRGCGDGSASRRPPDPVPSQNHFLGLHRPERGGLNADTHSSNRRCRTLLP